MKVEILLCLGLKGGCSGRRLAQIVKASPTPVFKALRGLVKGGIVGRYGRPPFHLYALNPRHPYHGEILTMIDKQVARRGKKRPSYLPQIAEDRRVDPLSVYEIVSLSESRKTGPKLSDRLRERYG